VAKIDVVLYLHKIGHVALRPGLPGITSASKRREHGSAEAASITAIRLHTISKPVPRRQRNFFSKTSQLAERLRI
jgi:hypothetical protein